MSKTHLARMEMVERMIDSITRLAKTGNPTEGIRMDLLNTVHDMVCIAATHGTLETTSKVYNKGGCYIMSDTVV